MAFHICHLHVWEANTRTNMSPHHQEMEYMFWHGMITIQFIYLSSELSLVNRKSKVTYSVLSHMTASSQEFNKSPSSDSSSLCLVLYQIYCPAPSCPPKYNLIGTTSWPSEQSCITRFSPTGSPVPKKGDSVAE